MSHDDFEIEPVEGLPELPPEGEHILWQGRPDALALARESLSLVWVALYFVVLAAWRTITLLPDMSLGEAFRAGSPFLIMGAGVCALLWLFAYIQARATVYTITNRRVAMRIGAALNVTLNLPYRWIGSADLKRGPGGTGIIALDLMGPVKLSYLVCWPHVRPWRIARPQPALRCIPDAQKIADMLAEAAQTRLTEQVMDRVRAPAAVAAE